MSLATIVQAACGKVGVPVPAAIATNTDPQIVQFMAIVNEEVEEASARHDWSALRSSALLSVTNVANRVGFVPWPAGFDRLASDGAPVHVGTYSPLVGPVSSSSWTMMTSGLNPMTSVNWRPADGGMQLVGVSSADQVAFDYLSNLAVRPQTGDPKPAFTIDTDVCRLPERLIRLGVIWRWKQAKGLEYGEDMSTYEREFERAASADTGPQSITMAGSSWDETPLTAPTVYVAAG